MDALRAFTYRTPHLELLRGRGDRFQPRSGPHLVLWWTPVPAPGVEEAMERLAHLARHGPSSHAFTFAQPYPPPGLTD